MSALDEARSLLARRSHRKVVIQRLTEIQSTLHVCHTNDVMKGVFGTELDEEVAEILRDVEERVEYAIVRLGQLNDEEEVGE